MKKKLKKYKEIEKLEKDRKTKQYWNFIKTYSFEDYKEHYENNIMKNLIIKIIMVCLTLLFFSAYIGTIYFMEQSFKKQIIIDNLEKDQQYNLDFLKTISKNECSKINQSYGYLQRLNLNENPQLLIFCSENNILIEGEKEVKQ